MPVLAYALGTAILAVIYPLVFGLPWWAGAFVGIVIGVGQGVWEKATRKPLRADPRRVAQLEYELGFADEKPPDPSFAYQQMCQMHKRAREAGIGWKDAQRALHAAQADKAMVQAIMAAREKGSNQ